MRTLRVLFELPIQTKAKVSEHFGLCFCNLQTTYNLRISCSAQDRRSTSLQATEQLVTYRVVSRNHNKYTAIVNNIVKNLNTKFEECFERSRLFVSLTTDEEVGSECDLMQDVEPNVKIQLNGLYSFCCIFWIYNVI